MSRPVMTKALRADPETPQGLSPSQQAIAELKALVGRRLYPEAFLDLVQTINPTSPDGKAWNRRMLDEVLTALTRQGVLDPDGGVKLALREPLLLAVLARPKAAELIMAVRAASPQSPIDRGWRSWDKASPFRDEHLARAVRLCALANNEDEVERLIKAAEAAPTEFRTDLSLSAALIDGCPAALGFIDQLTPRLRDRVAAGKVETVLDFGHVEPGVEVLIEALRDRTWDWALYPRLDRALLRLDLMDERKDAAMRRIPRVMAFDAPVALAAEATLVFLTEPGSDASPLFRDALKLQRKLTGRRRSVLVREFGLYQALALLATEDPSLHRELALLIESIKAVGSVDTEPLDWLLLLLAGQDQAANAAAKNHLSLNREGPVRGGPLEVALTALGLGLIDAQWCVQQRSAVRQSVIVWGRLARLPLRVIAQAQIRAGGDKDDFEEVVRRLSPGYPRNVLEIVPLKEPWERTLDRLETFVLPSKVPIKAEGAVAAARRLIFRLDPRTQEITVYEQVSAKGNWSGGRALGLKRLFESEPQPDYVTAEDKRALETLQLNRNRYPPQVAFDPVEGPLALVGHPRVFDARHPDRAVDLVEYPAELVVREDGEELLLDLSQRAVGPCVCIEPETQTRWRVIKITPKLVELGELLGQNGLRIPKSALGRVLALVRTDNPAIPVRSELPGAAEAAPGDATPVLQLKPLGQGLLVTGVVRPLGPEGAAYTPGLGASSVLVSGPSGQRRIRRDLEAEVNNLEAVAAACPALAPWREGDLDWRLKDLSAALEALQELDAFKGPLSLEWAEGARLKPTATVGAGRLALSIASAKDWFEVKGEIRVDEDLVLDMAAVLERLGEAEGRFIPLDEGRFLALTEDLRRRLEAFAAATEASGNGRRLAAAAALSGPVADLVDDAGAVKAEARWRALMEKVRTGAGTEPQVPLGLEAELRDYQREGYVWMRRLCSLGLGACLADDMGLGKTLQTLALLLSEAQRGPSIVLAPTSVCHNWMQEAARFAPALKLRALAAAPDRLALITSLGPFDVLVASYGLLHNEAEALASQRFAVAVFDEAQNLKNADTRRARAGKRIQADFKIALSGTPLENRLEELFSLFDLVSPGLLGTREGFLRRFASPIEKNRSAPAAGALKALVRPFLLRRTKAAVLAELPPRTEITLEVEPGPQERAFYEAVRMKALEALAGEGGASDQNRIRILAEITRLRRAACNPALIEPGIEVGCAKQEALLALARDLKANRHRALVFSQFTSHLDLVETALTAAGFSLLRLDGSTPAKARAGLVEAFQRGEGDLFLLSLKAGGVGLNLTGADYVIHLDPWWNPAVEDQATDRAHRMGQTRPVTVYRLVTADSIEQKILDLHLAKRTLSAEFLDGADVAGALGEDELLALIRD